MGAVDLKVVLLGKESSGKTSLSERYLNDRFFGDAETNNVYQSTIGAAYGERKIFCPEISSFVSMGIWDTAGGERYESMSRIYYRGAFAAVICYEVRNRESWDRLKYWINEVRTFERDCKIYICATKKDLLGTYVVGHIKPSILILRFEMNAGFFFLFPL